MSSVIQWAIGLCVMVALAALGSAFRSDRRLTLTEAQTNRNTQDIDKLDTRQIKLEDSQNEQGKILARLDENVAHIARGLEKIGAIPSH